MATIEPIEVMPLRKRLWKLSSLEMMPLRMRLFCCCCLPRSVWPGRPYLIKGSTLFRSLLSQSNIPHGALLQAGGLGAQLRRGGVIWPDSIRSRGTSTTVRRPGRC